MLDGLITSHGGFELLSILALALPVVAVYVVERRGGKEKLSHTRPMLLSNYLESLPEAVVVVDNAGRVVDVNSAAAQLASCTLEELRQQSIDSLSRLLVDHRHPKQPLIRRALRGESIREERQVIKHPRTGTSLEMLVSANPIRNQDGEILGALVAARDVTELTLLQRRIGDMERHYAIGQMAAAIAHDFNNVLDAIAQTAVLLGDENLPAGERRYLLETVQASVKQGAEITARVRDYLRAGTGTISENDILHLLHQVVDLTRPLWSRAKNLKLALELQPVGLVAANPADLRRVFTNLLINALEAMPHGGKLSIRCWQHEAWVYASVADTGSGISAKDRPNIFHPYFTTKTQGTGLGLSGAQKIVLELGGNIEFETNAGRGTKFTVRLPCKEHPRTTGEGERVESAQPGVALQFGKRRGKSPASQK